MCSDRAKPETMLMVIDVCGTLVMDDTTLGLLAFHFSKKMKISCRYLLFNFVTARLSPFRLGFIFLERISGKHLLKHFIVRLLRGVKTNDLDLSASEYSSQLLANRRVESVWKLLESHQRLDSRVILASASLEPIVKYLAIAISADYVASKLEQINGVLTGRYITDLTGRKDIEINLKYPGSLIEGNFSMISDNVTDKGLMERANAAFVVLHKKSHKNRWAGLNATYLDVNK